jgi:hypothetical protein
MDRLFKSFKKLFKEIGQNEDLINIYLVFMGIRSSCLISNIDLFYLIPKEANLEIHYGIYPGFNKIKVDYPLVCLKNSWVSIYLQLNEKEELTEKQLGLYLGFNCFDQKWKNIRINRYSIKYLLGTTEFYTEVCSVQPNIGMLARIKFKAKEMNNALKLINNKFIVSYKIKFLPGLLQRI